MSRTHAILDEASRQKKAKKILTLLQEEGAANFRQVLEIGTGSGFIANYFSRLDGTSVYSVDVTDERQVRDGFQFRIVDGTTLPYPDNCFDLVISNHVIEHVGPAPSQHTHLTEAFRCLRPGGVLYLAVPNRWRLIEPHYKLPLLSWLWPRLGHLYVRLSKRGTRYDCFLLSHAQAIALLEQAIFAVRDVTLEAIPLSAKIEGGRFAGLIAGLPRFLWRLAMPIMPTLIFICRKPASSPVPEEN